MSWNYRIMRHVDQLPNREATWFGLHEAYYTGDKVDSWTADAICGAFDSVDELVESLERMLKDAKKYRDEVLEYR